MSTSRNIRRRSICSAAILVAAAGAVGGGWASSARADGTIGDTEFNPANWSQEILLNEQTSWTATPSQSATDGNPGAFRRVDLTNSVPVGNPEYTLVTFDGYTGGTYDPATSGGLRGVSFGYDAIALRDLPPEHPHGGVTAAVFLNPALKQGDSVYALPFSYLANTPTWQHASLTNISASNFVKQSGSGPSTPNFTAAGTPITFGYNLWTRFNDWAMHYGVDNFNVATTSITAGLPTAGPYVVNVDIGNRAAYSGQGGLPSPGNQWNVTVGNSTNAFNFVNSQGNPVSVGYHWAGPYTNLHNLQPVSGISDYLGGAMPELNADGGVNGVGDDPTPGKYGGEMFVDGLVPSQKYTIALYGVGYGTDGDRVNTTRFIVNGKRLDTTSLEDGEGLNYIVHRDVIADANGELRVVVRNNSFTIDQHGIGGYWLVNGFQIQNGGTANPTWNTNGSANWGNSASWTGGVPSGAGSVAEFGSINTSPVAVNVEAPKTVGALAFNSLSKYTLSGAAITLDGGNGYDGLINVTKGTHEIASAINMPGRGEIVISTNAGLKLSGAVTGQLSRLAVGAGGQLDIATSSPLVVDYDTYSVMPDVVPLVVSGRGSGGWNGAGIASSLAAANSKLAVAAVESSALLGPSGGTFRGVDVDATSLILVVAIKGDSNLHDGVNFDDLVVLAQHYGDTSAQMTWTTGDFNYDGLVNFDDLVDVAQNYGFSTLSADEVNLVGANFAADFALAQSLVPEPATIAAAAAAGILALGRRRTASMSAGRATR